MTVTFTPATEHCTPLGLKAGKQCSEHRCGLHRAAKLFFEKQVTEHTCPIHHASCYVTGDGVDLNVWSTLLTSFFLLSGAQAHLIPNDDAVCIIVEGRACCWGRRKKAGGGRGTRQPPSAVHSAYLSVCSRGPCGSSRPALDSDSHAASCL